MSLEFPVDEYDIFQEFSQPLQFHVIEVIQTLTNKLKENSFLVSLVDKDKNRMPLFHNTPIEYIQQLRGDSKVIAVCSDYEIERSKIDNSELVKVEPRVFIEVSLPGDNYPNAQSDCYKLCEYIIHYLENNPDQLFHNKVKDLFAKKIEWIGALESSFRHGYRIIFTLTKY